MNTLIDLESNELGQEGSLAVIESLQRNLTLKELNLEFNNIGEEGGAAIA